MDREGLSYTIAKNITRLRRAHGLTQAALAEKLDYSDKSVSKWERAEGLPDVICLKRIADLFGVTVDSLLRDEHGADEACSVAVEMPSKKSYTTDKRAVVLISIVGVWILAAAVYLITFLCGYPLSLIFAISLPVTTLLLVIFNALWGERNLTFYAVTALVWSILFLVCFIFRSYNAWLLMLLGIPAALVVWLSCRVKVRLPDKPEDE
jgi:transcriptional regulator with XRE-family HTH domain